MFTKESEENIPELIATQDVGVQTCSFRVEDVIKVIESLKAESAPGPDGVHPTVLKECAKDLAKPLYRIFQASLATGELPQVWRRANVSPIFKKGSRTTALNYRPVSLTSVPCKLMEKVLRKEIVDHLESKNLLKSYQHGFRSGRSCLTQLLEYLEELESMVDEGDSVDVVYLDCRKAFDTVPHRRLLLKLEALGVRGNISRWIQNFLKDRKQRVCIRGSSSEWLDVWSGVPQGSVLGPVLFLVFINDLLESTHSKGKLFADDAKIYKRMKNEADGVTLQQDLDALQDWSRKWLLQFNEEKCKVMHIGRRNPRCQYHLGATPLEETIEEKDLGVIVTTNLRPSRQVCKAAASANSMLGLLRKTMTCLDPEMFLALYKALIRPRLEYCIQAWSPYTRGDIKKLEQVQRRATKLVPELAGYPYEERLSQLGLTTLEERRWRGDMIETYKILKGFDRVGDEDYLKLAPQGRHPGTRGHSLKLEKRRHRTQKRSKFFSSRVVDKWNSLPESRFLAIRSESVDVSSEDWCSACR